MRMVDETAMEHLAFQWFIEEKQDAENVPK
jgi:hypothetical protein